MADVQHIYKGQGSPVDTVVAPEGAHYIDENSGDTWFCVWSDGESSDWRCMAISEPVGVLSVSLSIDEEQNYEAVLTEGTVVSLGFEGPIYSSIELTGIPRSFTAASTCHMRLRPLYDGGALLTVTPLDAY